MVRISSTLLPTNGDGVPKQEIVNTSLTVSDSTSQTTLSSINTKLGGTLTTSDSTAQTNLATINTTLGGTLTVSDSTSQSTLSSINTKLAGTLTVSSSVSIAGSNGNFVTAGGVSSGGNSSVVDVAAYTKNTVYITSTTSDNVEIWISADGTNWVFHSDVFPQQPNAGGASYYAVQDLQNVVIDSVRLTYTGTATMTAGVVSRI